MTLQRVFCLLILVLGTVGSAGIATANGTGAAAGATVEIEQGYEQLDERGVVAVTISYDFGADMTSVRQRLDQDMTVVSTDGMDVERIDGERWLVWDEQRQSASATIHVQVNDTSDRFGGYSRYDGDDWALVPAVQLPIYYMWTGGGEPTIDWTRTVAGEGVAGSDLVYLGAYTEYNRTTEGETIRLIEPAAVDLADPAARLDALTYAAQRIDVDSADAGEESDEVLAVAGPDPLRSGQATGTDFFVNANSSLEVWLHEYTHTRQPYQDTSATSWTREAIAQYYGVVLAWEYDESVEYRRVQRLFESGQRDTSVLSRPATWGTNSDYVKGGTVIAMLDARIRNETDGNATFQDVLRVMNERDERLENGSVRESSTDVAGTSLDGYFASYVYGSASPPTGGYLVSRDFQSELSITTTVQNSSTGRLEITIRNDGPDVAISPTLRLNSTAEHVELAGNRRLRDGRASLAHIEAGASRTITVQLYAPLDERITERVSIAVDSDSDARANGSVAIAYGAPETTPTATPTATDTAPATATPGATDASAATPTERRTASSSSLSDLPKTGTAIDSLIQEQDDVLAVFGFLTGAGTALFGLTVGLLNALVSAVWRPFCSKRTVWFIIGSGGLVAAVSVGFVFL